MLRLIIPVVLLAALYATPSSAADFNVSVGVGNDGYVYYPYDRSYTRYYPYTYDTYGYYTPRYSYRSNADWYTTWGNDSWRDNSYWRGSNWDNGRRGSWDGRGSYNGRYGFTGRVTVR